MNSLKRLLCIFLCAALLLVSIGTASAAGKKNKGIIVGDLGDMTDDWYYVTSTIPDGYLCQEKQEVMISTNDGSDLPSEYAETCEITFKKGDEALANALVAEKEGEHWMAYIDNNALTAPGKAVFHFKAESPSFLYERDFTINVLDWNEYPLLEVENEHPVIDVTPGKAITDDEVAKAIGQLNTANIFDNVLKLKVRSWMASDYFIPRSNTDIECENSNVSRQYYPTFLTTRFDTVVNDYGEYEANFIYRKGNIRISVPVTFSARGYKISADQSLKQGTDIRFTVSGSTEGRTFTWSVEGEGATIDAESGVLKLETNALAGTVYTVTATADNGDIVSCKEFFAGPDCVFNDVQFGNTSAEGFQIPTPVGENWYSDSSFYVNDIFTNYTWENGLLVVEAQYYLPSSTNNFAEDPETARAEIERDFESFGKSSSDVENEVIDLDGHPVGLMKGSVDSNGQKYNTGIVVYIRNNRYLRIRTYNMANESAPITINDLKYLAYKIGYDEEQAPLSKAKAGFVIGSKDGSNSLSAGKNMQMTVTFENADIINKKEKNDGVSWSVVNVETGAEEPAATISKTGQLKVDKSLEAPVELEVKAVSDLFGTESTLHITAIPVVSGLSVEPAELFFYVGSEEPQTVKAALVPDTVPPIGITWTPAKDGLVEITPVEDGTVTIKPLAAGKVNITVKEPGGKNAKLTVSTVDPVETVELAAKGGAKAGGTVTIAATLAPKTAGNKNLEWSLDVGEDIATIDAKGKVKISKEAASGTKITVTCKALGAPEPIVSTIEIEIP